MRLYLQIAILHSVFLIAFASDAASSDCKSGEEKKIACNSCRCVNGNWACTRKACPPGSDRTRRETPKICTPGTSFKDDCNDCHCNEEGHSFCTDKLCVKHPQKRQIARCTPGTTFKQDCNTCTCGPNGVAACTLKACLPIQRLGRDTREQCTPGTTFKKACNSCTCGENGVAFCTQKFCL